ncbi:cadherin-like beta sandwich domain-containing protein [Paenibacillus sp. GCM10023252]|uniref:cadherin-like beta sandwich domain-containing protein n=1 Tax=Paenibacillus sp. GCM10023252 TaxID=3252649 RepID=UPI0036D3AA94
MLRTMKKQLPKVLVWFMLCNSLASLFVLQAYAAVSPLVIEAEAYAKQYGIQSTGSGIGYADSNDWLRYDQVDLTGYTQVDLTANILKTNARIELIINAQENGNSLVGGTVIGTLSGVPTADTNSSTSYATRTIMLNQIVSGSRNLYVRFGDTNGGFTYGIANVDKFTFTRQQVSANADLKQLAVSEGNLSPAFQPGITSYEWSVYGESSQVTITPQVMDTGYASLTINGAAHANNTPYSVNLNEEDSLAIAVTAESGAVKLYNVSIGRASTAPVVIEAEAYASQRGIQPVTSGIGYVDSNDWVRYDNVDLTDKKVIDVYANVLKTSTRMDFIIDATDDGTTLSGGTLIARLNGVAAADPNTSASFALHPVTLNQQVSGTHTLYIRFGDVNSGSSFGLANIDKYVVKSISYKNSDLKDIRLGSGAVLSPSFSTGVYTYTASTAGLTSVDVTAELAFPQLASIKINGTAQASGTAKSIPLIRGSNPVTIQAIAQDGTARTYTLTIENTGSVLRLEGESFQATGGASASTSGASQNGVTADLVNGAIGGTNNNDWARFDQVNLTPGYTDLTLRYATPADGVSVEVWLDSTVEYYDNVRSGLVGGTKLTSFKISGSERTASYTAFKTKTIALDPFTSGTHTVYLLFKGTDYGVMNVDWIEFNRNSFANADLSSIKVDEKSILSPAFNSNVTTYQVDVFDDVNTLELLPVVKDPLASAVTINGESWNPGTMYSVQTDAVSSVVIVVTGEEGGSKTYTLNINRRPLLMDVYVSTAGNDTNSGSLSSPFRTIARAVSQAAPGRGATIHLGVGVFEVAAVQLPQQTNLIGAGTGLTTIKASLMKAVTSYKQGDVTLYALQGRGLHDLSISGFTLEGQINATDLAHGGILLNNVTNVQLHDVVVQNFSYNGIWLENSVGSSIYNTAVYDTAYGNQQACLGNIMIGNMTDGSLHDIRIRETRGTYGIKAARSDTFNEGNGAFVPNSLLTHLTRVNMYNLDIDLRQRGLWGVGQPNIAIEMPGAITEEVEIFNSRFADSVSLISTEHLPEKSVRVHHNQFIAEKAGANGYTYAIEVTMENLEIDHNYFSNGYYPIASFGKKEGGHKIHHNVFDGIDGLRFLSYGNGLDDSTITNNVFRLTDSLETNWKGVVPFLYMNNGSSDRVAIERNLFISSTVRNDVDLIALGANASLGGSFTVKDNLFSNWKPYGTNPLEADPKLSYNDFRLASDSPAYGLGFEDIDVEPFGLPQSFFFAQPSEPIDRIYVREAGEVLTSPSLEGQPGDNLELAVTARTTGGTYKAIADSVVSYSAEDVSGSGVVSVNSQGVVSMLAHGMAKVTAVVNDAVSGTKTSSLYIQVTDEIAPTATVAYSTTSPTNEEVVATITASEPVTIVNNGGSASYTFTHNDSFTFEFVDAAGNAGTVAASAGNIDKTAPTMTVELDPSVIDENNHKLVTVNAAVAAADGDSGVASIVLRSITSNEPDNGTGDGNTTTDIQDAAFGTFDTVFRVSAERAGDGSGRSYTVVYAATDYAGNETTVAATVIVPH